MLPSRHNDLGFRRNIIRWGGAAEDLVASQVSNLCSLRMDIGGSVVPQVRSRDGSFSRSPINVIGVSGRTHRWYNIGGVTKYFNSLGHSKVAIKPIKPRIDLRLVLGARFTLRLHGGKTRLRMRGEAMRGSGIMGHVTVAI
jgi:hypothetical protein